MNEVIIDPSVPLSAPEWAAALERKRQMLLRDEYRPAKTAVPWPEPAPPAKDLADLKRHLY